MNVPGQPQGWDSGPALPQAGGHTPPPGEHEQGTPRRQTPTPEATRHTSRSQVPAMWLACLLGNGDKTGQPSVSLQGLQGHTLCGAQLLAVTSTQEHQIFSPSRP